MRYVPVFLRVAGRPCVVVGGGAVAQRKVESLLAAGARVTVISPEMTPALAALAAAGRLTHLARDYAPGDLDGCVLAYAATGDGALHAELAATARRAGVLLNVADQPALCDFIVPAVVARGELLIAASTGGASPALARRIRRELEEAYGPEYGLALQLLARLRARLAGGTWDAAARRRIFTRLVDSPLVDYLREHRGDAVDRLLAGTVGPEVSLASLGLELTGS